PKLNVEKILIELGVGEALVSMLDQEGKPTVVERARIVPPRSQVGAITPEQRQKIIQSSVLFGHYEKAIDRESAFEKLQARTAQTTGGMRAPTGSETPLPEGTKPSILDRVLGTAESVFQPRVGPRGGRYDSMATTVFRSGARAGGSQVGRQLMRGILGGLLGGSSRR